MEEYKSKSQKKRDAEALQQLGVNICALNKSQIKAMDLPELLEKAIFEAKKIKSHGALRRHFQYIGRIMRDVDIEPIQAAFDRLSAATAAENAHFHLIERWRDRLLNDGPQALTEFVSEYKVNDIQQLRHTIKKAISERDKQKNLGSSKALFRLIKNIIS